MRTSSVPRVVTICGDPGGGNAVAPVIERLRAEGKVSVTAFAYLQAATLWSEQGIQFDAINGDVGDGDIIKLLTEPKASLLLTGTSINTFELEKRFIDIARQLGIASISVLDFWSNYASRFSDDAGSLRYLPDQIAVMDSLARDEMIVAGIDSSHITITGHPALDGLEEYRYGFTHEQRAAVRKNFGVASDEWLVLYASQPPTFFDQDDSVPPPWLDRLRTVNALLRALSSLANERGKSATILIRPHPRESGEIYRGVAHDTVRIVVSGAGDTRDLTLAADVVVGMNTMLLVEACHLGRPTLSIRLALPLPDDFPANRSGVIRAIYREEDILPALEQALTACNFRDLLDTNPQPGNAVEKIASLVYRMVRQND